MDFNDTPEEAAFRAEARAFLAANAAAKDRARPVLRLGDLGADAVAQCKAWQAKKADAGFAGLTWPKQFGGREASPILQVIYQQEEENFSTRRGLFEIGLGMCIPTMMAYAKPEQLDRDVRPALRGEEVWCQLFSEPAGGSDLAALRTRAERDGEDWIINGQKIWTSGAHLSDFGIIVVRTDPNLPKREGLTFFFLDMKLQGVEVRPIHQMSGASHFNEVFFTDVRVPDAQRLGAVGQGWKVSLTTAVQPGADRPALDRHRFGTRPIATITAWPSWPGWIPAMTATGESERIRRRAVTRRDGAQSSSLNPALMVTW